MDFLIDTTILIYRIRDSEPWQRIQADYFLYESAVPVISTVSVGEVYGLATANNWGERRLEKMRAVLAETLTLGIRIEEIERLYGEIKAFNQKRHPFLSFSGSARALSDNDIWIAATAAHFGLPLLSTDKDFGHLDGKFVDFRLARVR